MAAPIIALGLKGADAVIDKHFHRIPDKYMHPNTYIPNNIPNPLSKKQKKRRKTRDQAQGRNDASSRSRSSSPSPLYDIEDADDIPTPSDIPRHSGHANGDAMRSPIGAGLHGFMPPQYSQLPPHVRPEYMPPPIGNLNPPPPQPGNEFPRQQDYHQFPPSSRSGEPNLRTPSVNDRSRPPPAWSTTGYPSRDRESRHRLRDRDLSSDDDRRGRRPKYTSRRSSSYQPAQKRNTYRHQQDDRDMDEAEEFYRSNRKPTNMSRRSSSQQPQGNNALVRYKSNDDDASDFTESPRPKTSPLTREVSRYDEEYDYYTSRARRRPTLETRRSSSYHGPRDRDSNRSSYPPSAHTTRGSRKRRDSLGSSSAAPRYSGRDLEDRSPPAENRENQFFTKSKEGLLSGALGAVVGGWAANRVHRSASGRDGRCGSGAGRGKGDDKVLTLLGAAVGGLAVNALVEHREEGKMKKERVERDRRDSRVYNWDDGYGRNRSR
ncbi:hypothetical protein BJ875DRAFT_458798 [Amylocarpus encephaloides]|uniref:Glycine zipper 2TM domain-containing protein n=1 Tax=Amylocarpus encephaloides TaxID=45428 RepID=A0A9P7YM27_9HELO|nr:hypothetical protein BJ875DRAFT_458798 [Amylocarpus encephaloides]